MQDRYAILDHLLEGCQIIDPEWRYLYANEALARHGRVARDHLIGRTMMEVYPGIEATPVFQQLRRCMEERVPIDLENEFTYPDGSTAWFELRVEPVPDGIFILSIDITERKRAEAEIERRIQQLNSLRAIDLAILGSTDLRLALRTVIEETRRSLNVDSASIYLLEPGQLHLGLAAGAGGMSLRLQSEKVRLGDGATGRAALERETVAVPDLEHTDEALEAEPLEPGTRALFAVPLIAKGNVLGVLRVTGRSPLNPDPDWLDFLEALAGQAAMAVDIGTAFQNLQRANLALNLAYDRTIEGWSRALDLRDEQTEDHSVRVTEATVRLARAAGIPDDQLTHVRRGALLHDIGKMGIPDRILLKPGPLTPEEWEIMRLHPVYAYEMLRPIEELRPALDIPYCHHEKWDGSGYPRGLAGEAIPLAARLFAVVDVWDALRSDRPYRAAWPAEKVEAFLRAEAGRHFDPRAVELFLRLSKEIAAEFRT